MIAVPESVQFRWYVSHTPSMINILWFFYVENIIDW